MSTPTVKLYSAVHFRAVGSSIQHDTARLVADTGDITSVGNLHWSDNQAKFDSLNEGESTSVTITLKNGGPMIADGWRVTRLPDYRINRVVFDEHAKEYVMVTNGKCVLDHSTPDAFRTSHIGTPLTHPDLPGRALIPVECQYAPSEAIALRVLTSDGGKVSVGWTYRTVDPCDLRPLKADDEQRVKASFDAIMSKKRSVRFVGRV